MKIIHLNQSMLHQVMRLERQCFSLPWSEELLSAGMLRDDFFDESSNNKSFNAGVCDEDGQLLAYVYATIVVDELHVLRIGVDVEHRQRGIGKFILRHVILEARRVGARYVLLECRKSNKAAQELYKSLDFLLVGVRRNYYLDDKEDALLFTCDLDKSESFLRESGLHSGEALQKVSHVSIKPCANDFCKKSLAIAGRAKSWG